MKTAFHRLPAGHARLCSEPPTHASRKPRVWGRDPGFLRGPKDIPKPRPSPGVCTTASHGLPEAQPSATIIYSINPQFGPPDSELSHTLADAKTPGLQVRTGRTCSREAGAQHPGVGGCAGDGVLLRTRKAPPLAARPIPKCRRPHNSPVLQEEKAGIFRRKAAAPPIHTPREMELLTGTQRSRRTRPLFPRGTTGTNRKHRRPGTLWCVPSICSSLHSPNTHVHTRVHTHTHARAPAASERSSQCGSFDTSRSRRS